MKKLLNILPLLALVFLAVIYGAVAVHMRWWPSQLVANAGNAITALLFVSEDELQKNWPTSMEFFDTTGYRGPTVIEHVPDAARSDELIFVDGGSQQLRSHCPDNGCVAWLMERDGTIRHVWSIGPELIWEGVDHVDGLRGAEAIYSVGSHPFPNGDLLVTYQGRNTYPYGVGMARFDKDSNLLWKKPNFAHHWFTVDDEGIIYVPAFSAVTAPHQLGDTNLQIDCRGGLLQEDVILMLSPDGEELDRISLADALVDSGYAGIFYQAIHSDRGLPLIWPECDPTHLNDVRIISAAQAATSPHLHEGDLLVSLRSNNALLAINKTSKKVTWASVGHTALQHSPRYMGDNTVLVFDNLGGAAAQGGSRVVRIDMSTEEVEQVYPRADDATATDVLSYNGGYIDVNPDGDRALVSLTRQGRTLEIDLNTGELLWEYLNIHDVSEVVDDAEGRTHARFATQTVVYFDQADFEFNEGKP